MGAAAVGFLFGPSGAARARGLAGRAAPGEAHADVERMGERMTAEVSELHSRLAELEERVDFAERLLARGGQADQIPGEIRR
jgi:hypothetical protein